MNRVLAVRGQVVPATATPLTLHAGAGRRDAWSTASRRSRKSPAIERAWVTPTDVRPSRGRARRDRRGGADRPRARAASTRASCRACSCPRSGTRSPRRRRFASSSATSRPRPARRPGSTSPTTSRRSSPTPGRTSSTSSSATTSSARGCRPATPAEAVRLRWPPSFAPPPRLVLDDVVDPANGHHHDPARLAAALIRLSSARAAAGGVPASPGPRSGLDDARP